MNMSIPLCFGLTVTTLFAATSAIAQSRIGWSGEVSGLTAYQGDADLNGGVTYHPPAIFCALGGLSYDFPRISCEV